MGFTYDFSAYPGRKRYWRILFLILTAAVVIVFFIAFIFLIEALSLVYMIQDPQRPSELTVGHLYSVLIMFQPYLIVATILYGPWLCLLLISVASHPTNPPRHLLWFLVGTLSTSIVVALWAQWFQFTPTFISLTDISMPQFPQTLVYLPETIYML